MSGPPTFNPLSDVISGVIMAATSVPQLIAYAETVGYAAPQGLSTAGPPLLAWGLSTGSPFMNSGVTSITALMANSDLNGGAYAAEHGEKEYVKLVAAYSMYVGIASILLAVVGFGKLAKSVPKPVRTGFKWGCSVGVLLSAFPNGLYGAGKKQLSSLVANSLFGSVIKLKSTLPGAVNVAGLFYTLSHPWEWSVVPAILCILGVAFIMKGKNYLPSFLPPGSDVIMVTALGTMYSMYFDYDGGIVGEIPPMDPDAGFSFFNGAIRLPIEFLDVKALFTEVPLVEQFGGSYIKLMITALLFAGVNFLSIMGIASGFEAENGIAWSAPRELIAQGVSCFAAGAVGSAPVSGSMSRSLVSRMSGTTSQMACLVTALTWIYLLPYMNVMSSTPKASLSAVIISAVLKSVVIPSALMQLKSYDFVIGWATGIVTCLTNPTQGFGFGLVFFYLLSVIRPKDEEKKTKAE